MTKEYKELIDRLKSGVMGDYDCFSILISRLGTDKKIIINNYASEYELVISIEALIRFAFDELDKDEMGLELLCWTLNDLYKEYDISRKEYKHLGYNEMPITND